MCFKIKWEITGNLNAFLSCWCLCLQTAINPCPDDILISFLPLAHMFERVVEVGIQFCLTCLLVCIVLSHCVLQKVLALNASDTHISFLPLAHMYEQLMQVSVTCGLAPSQWTLDSGPLWKRCKLFDSE